MVVTKRLIDTMAKPVFAVKSDGKIVQINEHGRLMLSKLLGRSEITSILEIEPDFDATKIDDMFVKTIYLQKLKLSIDIFPASYENGEPKVFIYIFDNILFNEEVDAIFNSIEYVINIVNSEGAIESLNNAAYTILGITHEDSSAGHNLVEHYEKKTTCITEPTFSNAMRERRGVVGRISYRTGTVLLNRATPVFSKDGKIKRVVIIGQNVSENAALDEMLILSGENNNVPTMVRFNEISQYFGDENYLITSEKMKKIVNRAIKVASSDSSVLIWGESGVGKEMIAKLIHYSGNRKTKPFVTINCAAIPAELMESELFGYEEGAFTGAKRLGKKGLLEEANGGTVFLDELGEMPYPLQSKLLRAIQENKIRKVGSNKDIPINVRYVSATNLKIEQILDNNILREDLYYRLGVIPINIPPLRQRREDIIPLVKHFMSYYNEREGKTVILSKKALQKLINYDWPGNIRELKNTIERNVLFAEKDLIEDIDIDVDIQDLESENDILPEQNIVINHTVSMDEAYNEVFNRLVKKVYQEKKSIVKTAETLGINPSTIHRKIKDGRLNLEKEKE